MNTTDRCSGTIPHIREWIYCSWNPAFASHTFKRLNFIGIHFNAKKTPRVLALVSFVKEIRICLCSSFLGAFEPLSRKKSCNLIAKTPLPRDFMLNIHRELFACSVEIKKNNHKRLQNSSLTPYCE